MSSEVEWAAEAEPCKTVLREGFGEWKTRIGAGGRFRTAISGMVSRRIA
jgi:hypothetical protein